MTHRYPPFVPLETHAVALNLLLYLIDLADRGQPDILLSFLEPSEIDDLRNLPVKDLLRTTDQGQPILRISLDPRQLRLCLQRLRSRDDSDADKLWFVRRGAPHVLMAELFGISERNFRALRRAAGGNAKPGRPAAMDAIVEAKVLARWRQFSPATTFIQRYRVIGEAFESLSFASLYSLLHDQT
jgi:hypothetical protein